MRVTEQDGKFRYQFGKPKHAELAFENDRQEAIGRYRVGAVLVMICGRIWYCKTVITNIRRFRRWIDCRRVMKRSTGLR